MNTCKAKQKPNTSFLLMPYILLTLTLSDNLWDQGANVDFIFFQDIFYVAY